MDQRSVDMYVFHANLCASMCASACVYVHKYIQITLVVLFHGTGWKCIEQRLVIRHCLVCSLLNWRLMEKKTCWSNLTLPTEMI